MRKKLLATVLAASMVLAMAPVLPVSTGTVASAEEAVETETLTGNGWFPAEGAPASQHYKIAGDSSVTLYVGVQQANADSYSAFSVELNDGVNFITTGSDINIWTVGDAVAGATVEGAVEGFPGVPVEGHLYKITVTRTGDDFTIEYFDVTDNTVFCSLAAKGAPMGADVDVYVMAQVGTFLVGTAEFDFEVPEKPDAPENPGSDSTDSTDGTDFSAIETQPVVGYTFDNADGLELAGEANVAEGILNLATSETHNVTYAKIADLSSYDFSNGITLTADICVAGYISDWTPIFMLGDGTLGGEIAGATITYHFTQGFSSRDDISNVGYYGDVVAAPYTWDFFATESNRNKWYTVAVTIAPNKMTTYINGVEVESGAGDYTALLTAFGSANSNYLGSSYWSQDADFMGSMDNVGIYNTALSAKDMADLVGAEFTEQPGNEDPGNEDPGNETPAKKTMKISKITAKKNATKVTGTVSVKKATVKVKVGNKKYKKATVNGKKFTIKVAKLKKGTKVTVKATKSGYKAVTKSVKVK